MKVTTVFLDAGGVILDESEQEHALAEVAVEALSEVVEDYALDDYWGDVEEASRIYAPRIYQYVFFKHLKRDPVSFDEVYPRFLSTWHERRPPLKLMQELPDEVKNLSGDFDLGILGQYGKEVLELLDEHSLLDCFKYTYTQDDFELTKPDPRYYEHVTEACGVNPRECIMVGDRLDKDVVPARQVGMKTIRIRVGILKGQDPRIPFEVPDIELPSVAGLADAVRTLAGRG
jgi:HAD superfamily hydrolase (TIGR01549 family)